MALHAVDDLGDAFAATRAFLLPFDAGRWLRLAVVALFVGGVGGNVPSSGLQIDGGTVDPGPVEPTLPDVGGQVLGLVLLVVAVLLALGLLVGFVGSVMEFVLVASLREEEVHVRRYVREHWRAGARLFGFRIALALLGVALVALPVAALVFGTGGPAAVDGPGRVFGLLLLLIPLVLLVALALSLVDGFTTFFVVPVMLLEGEGVLASWRRFYATLRAEWREYLVFVVLTFVLTLVAGTAVGVVVGLVALVVLGPLVLFGLAGVVTAGVVGPGAIGAVSLPVLLAVGVLGLLAFLLVLVVAAVVQVPVVTYFRYYALLLLGDTDTDLDLVPERRRAVRAGDGDGHGNGGPGVDSA
jgi:hypothetical protein